MISKIALVLMLLLFRLLTAAVVSGETDTTANCSSVFSSYCLPVGYDMTEPDTRPMTLDIIINLEVKDLVDPSRQALDRKNALYGKILTPLSF